MSLKVKEFNDNLFEVMEVSYLGHSCFRIKGKTASVLTDPFDSQMVGVAFPKVQSDIVIISHHHKDHDAYSQVENVKKVIDGPGEYEVNGVSLIGVSTFHDNKKGAERGRNTIYVIEIDGMRLLHVGDLGHELTDEQIKAIGAIDILFVPVGGVYTLDPKMAVSVVKQVGPSITIPMHYKMVGAKDGVGDKLCGVEDFLKEYGGRVEKLPKLNIKEGDIKSDEEYCVVLEKK